MKLISGNKSLVLSEKEKTKVYDIILEKHITSDRNISCKELHDRGICKWLKEFKPRQFRCNGKNKQPISCYWYERPKWCPLLREQRR